LARNGTLGWSSWTCQSRDAAVTLMRAAAVPDAKSVASRASVAWAGL